MALDLTDLKTAATEVIALFNAVADNLSTSYDNLLAMMDSNIVLKKVIHPDSVVGIGNVGTYLNSTMKSLKPKLTYNPNNLVLYPKNNPNSGTYAQVSGAGQYFDGASNNPISFILTFVRNTNLDNWSLNSSFAYPTS